MTRASAAWAEWNLAAVLADLNPVDAGLKRVALQPMKKKSSAVDECWRLPQ
jgi:hypothetical protein